MSKMEAIHICEANRNKVTNLLIDDNWQSLVSRFPPSFDRISSYVQGQ